MNREELVVGSIASLVLFPVIGPWCLLLSPVTAILWALGGSVHKVYRRLGVPLVYAVVIGIKTHSWLSLIVIPLGYGIECIGYGTPDVNDDEASWLGTQCLKIARGSQLVATILSRGVILLLLLVSVLITIFATGV